MRIIQFARNWFQTLPTAEQFHRTIAEHRAILSAAEKEPVLVRIGDALLENATATYSRLMRHETNTELQKFFFEYLSETATRRSEVCLAKRYEQLQMIAPAGSTASLDAACAALANIPCPQDHDHRVYFREEQQGRKTHPVEPLIIHAGPFYRGSLRTIDFM